MVVASAALAVGGSLAVAGSASAIPIPFGSATDTGSTTVHGLYNQSSAGLVQAQNLIVLTNGILAGSGKAPIDAGFTTPFTSASSLTATNVAEIGTDISKAANAQPLELGVCVDGVLTAQNLPPTSTNVAAAATTCETAEAANVSPWTAAVANFTGKTQPGVAAAVAAWPQLSSLLSNLSAFPGTLYSLDSGVTVNSAATVTAPGAPTAYSTSVTANPSGGYVLPNKFTMTFPADFSVNTALAGAELQPSQEANPPASSAVGTVTLNTPVASEFGGTGTTLTGKVYVINANGSITQPDLELSFGPGIYELGTFPSTLSFPLTLTFGEANVAGQTLPIPFSGVSIAFPAATSPVKALNCSNLGSVGGGGTDEVASLAAEFGDTGDAGTTTFTSNPTAVTDECVPSGAVKFAVKRTGPTFSVTVKANGSTPFKATTISLPSGITAKGLKAKDLKVTGAKLKSVSGSSKVTVAFKSATKSATIQFVKGVKVSSKLLKSIAKHKTKSLKVKFTVTYAPTGAPTATSAAGSVTVKHL